MSENSKKRPLENNDRDWSSSSKDSDSDSQLPVNSANNSYGSSSSSSSSGYSSNSNNSNNSNSDFNHESNVRTSPSRVDAKRIKISDEERALNGAPDWDLFDMNVVEDQDLSPLPTEQATLVGVEFILAGHFENYSGQAVWADKFAIVESLRRIVRHHKEHIGPCHVFGIVDIAVDGLSSLRSCSIRNSLLLAQSIVEQIDSLRNDTQEVTRVLTALILRTSSGPKFLVEQAHDALVRCLQLISLDIAIPVLHSHIGHKNAEVASRVQILIGKMYIDHQPSIRSLGETSPIVGLVVEGLCAGMNSKRPAAKEQARNSLREMMQSFGRESLSKLLTAANQSDSQVTLLLRAVEAEESAPVGPKKVLALKDITNKASSSTASAAAKPWKRPAAGANSAMPSVVAPVAMAVAAGGGNSSFQAQAAAINIPPVSEILPTSNVPTSQPAPAPAPTPKAAPSVISFKPMHNNSQTPVPSVTSQSVSVKKPENSTFKCFEDPVDNAPSQSVRRPELPSSIDLAALERLRAMVKKTVPASTSSSSSANNSVVKKLASGEVAGRQAAPLASNNSNNSSNTARPAAKPSTISFDML